VSEDAAEVGKLTEVHTLEDLVKTANSYIVLKPRNIRWIITLTNFRNQTLKIRVTVPVVNRFITLLNINYHQLNDLLNIVTLLKERLDRVNGVEKFIPQRTVELDI